MKNILYIGNNLKSKASNLSGIQTLGALLEKEGYNIKYSSSKINKFYRLLDMVKSCVVLSRTVDLVLIDTYSTQNFYYAWLVSQICRLNKQSYIPILHGGNLTERLKAHPKKSRMIFKYAKYNVSPSLYLKKAFENHDYNNIVHIPNTLEIENYPFALKKYDTPRLLWVRSFSEIYNPKLAVQVYKSLKDTYPNAEMCMIGPDSDGTLKDIKALNQKLSLDIKFTGKLSKKEWVERSKDYNIFINTTNFDNMPVSVIEAMSLGLPVVSTNVGGMPYLIKDKLTGILVKPNDTNAMVQGILDVMGNAINRKMIIENARAQAEGFDWTHVKKQWTNILSS